MHSYESTLISWIVAFFLLMAPLPLSAGCELPAFSGSDQIVRHSAYTLKYSEEHEQAEWVAYTLRDYMTSGPVSRTDDFRPDPLVKTGSAAPADYRRSGYDRGHLVPAADMKHSRECMSETFYMSNMSPQRPAFNRGVWKDLEELVRQWVREDKELHVVAGPVLTGKGFPVIGPNRVSVPDFYYKVILDCREPGFKAIGFVLPNGKAVSDLREFAVPVDRVEEITGIDFYPALPDDVEEMLESSNDFREWPLPGQALHDGGSSVRADRDSGRDRACSRPAIETGCGTTAPAGCAVDDGIRAGRRRASGTITCRWPGGPGKRDCP